MPTPIVVLTTPQAAAAPATAYAGRLAKAIGVPLQLAHPEATAHLLSGGRLPSLPYLPRHATGFGQPASVGSSGGHLPPPTLTATMAPQDTLLLLLARPNGREATSAWLTHLALKLLQTTTQPVLLVPGQPPGGVPLRIALAADGELFRLGAGRRLLHTLLFTLPIQLTVVHVQRPEPAFSGADALQSVLACGLATRSVATHLATVVSSSPAAGILLGAQQAQADLIVLIVRPRSLHMPRFAQGVTAALLQQSPVPVLLLAAEA